MIAVIRTTNHKKKFQRSKFVQNSIDLEILQERYIITYAETNG
jgi:hypothetical protein